MSYDDDQEAGSSETFASEESLPLAGVTRFEVTIDSSVPYKTAKAEMVARYERAYAEQILRSHTGNITRAACAAQLDRVYFLRLLDRHGLRRGSAPREDDGSHGEHNNGTIHIALRRRYFKSTATRERSQRFARHGRAEFRSLAEGLT